MTVLKGLRIIEISAMGATADAARHFAGWGAEVVILEPPSGTPLRESVPHYEVRSQRRSATWDWLSRGKRTVRVRPEAARMLCEAADLVLIEPALAQSVLGLAPTELRGWAKNRVNVVLVPAFPVEGPLGAYRATDLGVMARGGWMDSLQSPGREPIRPSFDLIYRVSGALAFFIGLVVLRQERLHGGRQFAEVPMQGVSASMLTSPWLVRSMMGGERPFWAAADAPGSWPMSNVLPCKDGWFGCLPLSAKHWEGMCRMFGIEDVLEEPGGRGMDYRMKHSVELWRRVAPMLMSMTRAELMAAAQRNGVTAAPICSISERLEDEQLAARRFFKLAEISGRTVKTPRIPYLLDGAEAQALGPLVEGDAPQWPSRPPAAAAVPPPAAVEGRSQPFAGIRVLDLSHFWAGPYATLLLGTLGAEVIKIESVRHPDAFRYTIVDHEAPQCWEKGPLWNDTNAAKRGITLDLASAAGREILLRLAREADVVISNFSNRVMPQLGLTDKALHAVNPRLVIVTMPGYGPDGPWGDYVGYGVAFEQLASCASMTGYPGETPKIPSGFCDPMSGTFAAAAIELALRERERTGKGMSIQVPQCETVDALFGPEYLAVQHGVPARTARANRHEWMAPHNAYRVAGPEEWLTIAVATDAEFAALVDELGAPRLAKDTRFATVAARKDNEAALDAALAALVANQPLLPLEARLQARGVMACRVTKGGRLPEDAALQHFGLFQELSRAVTGTHPYRRIPVHIEGVSTALTRAPPTLGEHTAEVLTELLGLSVAELNELADQKVIGTTPV